MTIETAQLPADLEVTACDRNECFAAAFLGVNTLRQWHKVNGKSVRRSLVDLTWLIAFHPLGGGQWV